MSSALTPYDIKTIMACGTGCLGLIILVLLTLIGVLDGVITSQILGTVSGLTTGGGILGFAALLVLLIKSSFAQVMR